MRLLLVLAAVLVSGLFYGCSSTQTSPESPASPSYKEIAVLASNGITGTLYASEDLKAGFNDIYFSFERNGSKITLRNVAVTALMNMGMMNHSCPIIPPSQTPNEFDDYSFGIIFQMPGSSSQWTVTISAEDTNSGELIEFAFGLDVLASSNVKVVSIGNDGDHGHKLVVALVHDKWKVGMNEFDVAVYATMDGMNFMPQNSLALITEPTMPSMGHGSHGNKHPTWLHDAWYRGELNLTMSGDWLLTVDGSLAHGSETHDFSTTFDIVVP